MDKPVIIDVRRFRPLPKVMWGLDCFSCKKAQARWGHTEGMSELVPFCALCFLYDSVWGRDHVREITALVNDVETRIGRPFPKLASGRLAFATDADRILSSVVIVSKIESIQKSRRP